MAGCAAAAPEPSASSSVSGDAELLAAIRPTFTDRRAQVAVAVLAGDEVRTAFIRADAHTLFETGSITKTFTGLLLAEAIERGEVELDDQIGEYVDLDDAPAASVTFEELSAHRSGLPTFPSDPAWRERVEEGFLAGKDVVDETVEELLAEASAEPLPPDAPPQYSNMGAALVGQALASAAGVDDYRTLIAERIFEPSGMDEAVLPVEDHEVPEGLARGWTADGAEAEPSTLGAYAPAGGVAATVGDLVAYARAVIDGPFAGSAALEPRPGLEGSDIGYFWGVSTANGHEIVEHNGQTAGFASILVIDRTAGTAAVVLSNQGRIIDEVGARLLRLADG